MSRLIEGSAASYEVSRAAMEEASRFSQHTVDVDHLLLALVISDKPAGRVLRDLGVTLAQARGAVAGVHEKQLAGLGIEVELPQQERIAQQISGGDFDWTERARQVLLAASSNQREFTVALLGELLDEPSGLVDEVLNALGVSAAQIRHRLDAAPEPAAMPVKGGISGTSQCFVPAPVEQVWDLLVTPSRMSEWGPMYALVEFEGGQAQPGDTWFGHAAQGGGQIREQVELLIREERSRIAWRTSRVGAPKLNSKRVEIELVPTNGGTRLVIDLAWERSAERPARSAWPNAVRAVLRKPLSSLYRQIAAGQAAHLGASIGRVFR